MDFIDIYRIVNHMVLFIYAADYIDFKFFIYLKVGEYMNWIESIKKYTPFNEQEKKDKKII